MKNTYARTVSSEIRSVALKVPIIAAAEVLTRIDFACTD